MAREYNPQNVKQGSWLVCSPVAAEPARKGWADVSAGYGALIIVIYEKGKQKCWREQESGMHGVYGLADFCSHAPFTAAR